MWAGYYLAFLIFADHFSSQVIDFCMHMAKNKLLISVMTLDQLLNLLKMYGNNDQFISVQWTSKEKMLCHDSFLKSDLKLFSIHSLCDGSTWGEATDIL